MHYKAICEVNCENETESRSVTYILKYFKFDILIEVQTSTIATCASKKLMSVIPQNDACMWAEQDVLGVRCWKENLPRESCT